MAMTAEAIIFAINSAIRLGRNAQRAYAKSLTSKSIVLPLPRFSGTPNAFTAQSFFDNEDERTGGAQYLSKMERLKDVHERFKNGMGDQVPTDRELEMYVDAYSQLSMVLEQEAQADFQNGLDDRHINADELVALLSIRQYTHDSAKHTSPLQMVAGTLVEIGIDYFNRTPGALNEQSATGRTLKYFLKAFDNLEFSDNTALRQQSKKIIPQLFIAAAETLSDLGQEAVNDPKIQAFVHAAGKGIAEDLFTRLQNISDSDNQDEAVKWGRFLLRSTVSNAGNYVFAAPQQFFDTNSGASALIQATSSVLMDAILHDPNQLDIKNGINAETLDRLLQTSFGVIAEHPQLIQNRNGFREIVVGVSSALKDYDFRRPDLFPELVRLVTQQLGQNLMLIRHQPTGAGPIINDGKDLLLRTLQLIFRELSRPVHNGSWKPRLSKSQLLSITESLLDQVITNPSWIEDEVDEKPLLSLVLRTTLDSLALIPSSERLRADTFNYLLQLNLRTVAANELVLQKIRWSDDQEEEAVLQQSLNLVFTFVFDRDQVTAADRYVLLGDLLDYILDVIVSRHPDRRGLLLVDLLLSANSGLDYSGGFNRKFANALVDAALDTLAAHPDLISRKAALGEIVAGIAAALDASSFQQADLLIELVRLSLENTALNAHLIVASTEDEPNYILVIFIRELLMALSHKEEDDQVWQPELTPQEALAIVDQMVDKIILHPEWIVRGPDGQIIFRDVLQAVRNAMRELPAGTKMTPDLLESFIALAMHAAVTSQAVLDEIPWGDDTEKKSILERALALVGTFIFSEMQVGGAERLGRFADFVEYVLDVILIYHPDRKGLLLTQLILFGEQDIDYSLGIDETLLTDLVESALRVMEQHPDLVSNDLALQNIVSGIAGALEAGDFRQKGVLPDLVRLVLETTALNAQLVIEGEAGSLEFLVAAALQDLITPLVRKGTEGEWQPQLSGDDLFLLAEELFEELEANPHWIIPTSTTEPTVWQQVAPAVLNALTLLPPTTRLAVTDLEDLFIESLQATANGPLLVNLIQWGDATEEKPILQCMLEILVRHVYPADAGSSAQQLERFLEILDFALEEIIHPYPDKRGLLLIHLIFSYYEANLAESFATGKALEVASNGRDLLNAYPILVEQEGIFQKILRDTKRAMRAAKTTVDHLWLDFVQLVLHHGAGHLDRLMRLRLNGPRIILATALEQTLRVVTQPAGRGRWRPSTTDEQLLHVVDMIFQRVVERPNWVNGDMLIRKTLEALYVSFDDLKREQALPFESITFLINSSLEAVSIRRQLILPTEGSEIESDQTVLARAICGVFTALFATHDDTPGSWALSETASLHLLIDAVLQRLAEGPAEQAFVDLLLQIIDGAIIQINNNSAFTLEDLLSDINQAEPATT